MSEYKFQEIEKKWQIYWHENRVFKTSEVSGKPKYYVLDMFPYPSGAGLHVGHPLGYIATDIMARYKRARGFNVLHPMGFDSFGLPAEQYAIKTGQHPAKTTETNINRFKEQLEVLGFSYDWDREVRTSDPNYYRWTQWIFLKLFNSYIDPNEHKARDINDLEIPEGLTSEETQDFINGQRLAYQAEIAVNWCPELGTVLANEEVIGGVSERGGYPVIRKPMRQWMLRITSYADRLIDDLDSLEWPESIKASQRNWIGRSYGADINFKISGTVESIIVYTTRPDTIYGVTYMVLAPEHQLVQLITTAEQKSKVDGYLDQTSKKSDLERTDLDKSKTGVFTGAYAVNPVNQEKIPIWISDYVLISYGTGAVMAVPGGDQRDFEFAKEFDLPIIPVVAEKGHHEDLEEAYTGHGTMINSGEYNGLHSKEFTRIIIERIEKEGVGRAAVNYKLRDWVFTRQRYWGEPIPLVHTDSHGVVSVPEDQLPVILPEVEDYQPTQDGESPLAKVLDWVNTISPIDGTPAKRETNTMPQWAGSCWYYLRFMDPENHQVFADNKKLAQWSPVDLYVGGAEHAVLHLLYARFWHKVLFDLGYVPTNEPFQKLVNQGMIQGLSAKIFIDGNESGYFASNRFDYKGVTYTNDANRTFYLFFSKDVVKADNMLSNTDVRKGAVLRELHVQVDLVNNENLNIDQFIADNPNFVNSIFVCKNGYYLDGSFNYFQGIDSRQPNGNFLVKREVEKMSKSKLNVVSPDAIVARYGADTLRMYEMFLGPLEQGKPWSTHGIDGVFRFLRKFWNLFHDEAGNPAVEDIKASTDELKITHRTIKKVAEDIERLSFNTCVSSLMICVNELTALKCRKKAVLQPLVLVIAPFAPHLAEDLWQLLGNDSSVSQASFPQYNEDYLKEDTYEYPVSVNGKMRAKMKFAVDLAAEDIEKQVLAADIIKKWVGDKTPKKVIVVPGKIVNVVV